MDMSTNGIGLGHTAGRTCWTPSTWYCNLLVLRLGCVMLVCTSVLCCFMHVHVDAVGSSSIIYSFDWYKVDVPPDHDLELCHMDCQGYSHLKYCTAGFAYCFRCLVKLVACKVSSMSSSQACIKKLSANYLYLIANSELLCCTVGY